MSVVIDPGHGGTQTVGGSSPNNATGPNGTLEKELTLDLARRVQDALLAYDQPSILTRNQDVNLGLAARARIARDVEASAFVSIHLNDFRDPSVQGTETWLDTSHTENSSQLAAAVHAPMVEATGLRDRGIRTKNLGVLRASRHHASTAACLVEVSFLSEPNEEQRLGSDDYKDSVARGIATGIINYLRRDAWAGFDLRRGDSDEHLVYAGQTRPTAPDYLVRDLKRTLVDLGFLYFGRGVRTGADVTGNHNFDVRLEWALREFQIYAKAPRFLTRTEQTGAKQHADIYTGPVSGVLNARTRALLQLWRSRRWVCPVKISIVRPACRNPATDPDNSRPCDSSSWTKDVASGPHVLEENIWHAQDHRVPKAPALVRDFSGLWEPYDAATNVNLLQPGEPLTDALLEGSRSDPSAWQPVGNWNSYTDDDCGIIEGPFTRHRYSPAEQELLPVPLIGEDIPSLGNGTPAEQEKAEKLRSTFKVVRAVADEECVGYFDGITAYDVAVMSTGPAHWTLLLEGEEACKEAGRVGGELMATIGYLESVSPQAFQAAFGRFGLAPERGWDSGTGLATGAEIASHGQLKYTDYLALERDDGSFGVPQEPGVDGEWLRGWHWTFRFVMAARRITRWRRTFWDMARKRIDDVRETQVTFKSDNDTVTTRLGDIVQSEAAMAFVYRYHIFRPGTIIKSGNNRRIPGNWIRSAIEENYSSVGTPQEALLKAFLQREKLKISAQDLADLPEEGLEAGWRIGKPERWKKKTAPGDWRFTHACQARRVTSWPSYMALKGPGNVPSRRELGDNFRKFRIRPEHLYKDALDDDIRLLISSENAFQFYDAGLPDSWWADTTNNIQLRNLATRLARLGFGPTGPTSGALSVVSRHPAVREFQAAAAMPAMLTTTAASGTPNARRYRGRIGQVRPHDIASRRVNTALAHLVLFWEGQGARAPQVMAVHNVDGTGAPQLPAVESGFWSGQLPTDRQGVFASDASGHYSAIGFGSGDREPVGRRNAARQGIEARNSRDAQGNLVRMCLAAAEVTPRNLFGLSNIPNGTSGDPLRSTFKTVRAVAEELFGGFLDGISTYTAEGFRFAFWTGPRATGAASQEVRDSLGGFLAFLSHAVPDVGRLLTNAHGLYLEETWQRTRDGKPSKDSAIPVDASGMVIRNQPNLVPVAAYGWRGRDRSVDRRWTQHEVAHFLEWHWVFRFQVLARHSADMRRVVWDAVRMRLRDLLYAPWPVADGLQFPFGSEFSKNVRIGQVWTSEQSRAVLLAAHCLQPDAVVRGQQAGPALMAALAQVRSDRTAAGTPLSDNIKEWDNNVDRELVDALLAGSDLSTTTIARLQRVKAWTHNGPNQAHGYALTVLEVDPDATVLQLDDTRRGLLFEHLGESFSGLPVPLESLPGGLETILLRLQAPGSGGSIAGFGLVSSVAPASASVGAAMVPSVQITGLATTRSGAGVGLETGIVIPFARPVEVPGLGPDGQPGGEVSLFDEPEVERRMRVANAMVVGDRPIEIEEGLDIALLFAGSELFRGEAGIRIELTPSTNTSYDMKLVLTLRLDSDILTKPLSFELIIDPAGLTLGTSGNATWVELTRNLGQLEGLPIGLKNPSAVLKAGVDGHKPFLAIELSADGMALEIGSPMVQLGTNFGVTAGLDTRHGLAAGFKRPADGEQRKLSFRVVPFSQGLAGTPAGAQIGHVLSNPDVTAEFEPAIEIEIDLFGQHNSAPSPAPERVSSRSAASGVANVVDPQLRWRSARLELGADLLENMRNSVSQTLKLPAFSGETIGGEGPLDVRLIIKDDNVSKPPRPSLSEQLRTRDALNLYVRAEVDVGTVGRRTSGLDKVVSEQGKAGRKTIFAGETEIGLEIRFEPNDETGFVVLAPTAFRLDPVRVTVFTGEPRGTQFGNIASLYVPSGAAFTFDLDPRTPSFSFDRERTARRQAYKKIVGDMSVIALSVPGRMSSQNQRDRIKSPGDRSFTFELDEFRVSPSGLDLKGGVRAENVPLWVTRSDRAGDPDEQVGTGLDKPVAVEPPKKQRGRAPRIGEIEIRGGRLTRLMLRASSKLHYFDDAVGTLTVVGSQDEARGGVTVIGTFELSGRKVFHLDDVFASVEVTHIVLGTEFNSERGPVKWLSEGRLTGSMKFAPANGGSSADTGVFARLFEGVTISFEDLDIVNLGVARLRVETTPARFQIGEILEVEIHGVEFFPARAGGGFVIGNKQVRVLGGIEILKLPSVDASLSFGGVNLRQIDGSIIPAIDVERVSMSLGLPGGTRISGTAAQIKNEAEFGFGGEVGIEMPGLPRMDGLVKLTRVTVFDVDDNPTDVVPSIAVYLEREWVMQIYGGFFFRRIGFGAGIHQGLRNLTGSDPLPKRIEKFVNDPRGLPNPGRLDSWEPSPPVETGGPLRWSIVGQAYITYGNYDSSKEHVLTGSVLLSIDQALDIVAGVNLWLFTSPDQARTDEFYAKPVARGAIGISPREGRIYGTFINLPDAKMGRSAPDILSQVLSIVRTRITFLVDRNGAIYEVGWPWDTRIAYSKGPFSGALTSGYRYGIYRGVVAAGVNYAIDLRLQASADLSFGTAWGRAGAKLIANGHIYFRATFMGAVTPRLDMYVLGDVRFGAVIDVRLSAYVVFRFKIGFIRISISIRFSVRLNLAIHAALAAAVSTRGIGFDGSARVSISVAGFSVRGRVPFRYNAGLVSQTRSTLRRLMPPINELIGSSSRRSVPPPTPESRRSAASQAPSSTGVEGRISARAAALNVGHVVSAAGEGESTSLTRAKTATARGAGSQARAASPVSWTLRLRHDSRRKQLRLLLLPEAGGHYAGLEQAAGQASAEDLEAARRCVIRFSQTFLDNFELRGFLADGNPDDIQLNGSALEWYEHFDLPIVPAEQVAARATLERNEQAGSEAPPDLLLRDLLLEVDDSGEPDEPAPSTALGEGTDDNREPIAERIDPRTLNPSPDDADEASRGLGGTHPSPRIARRNGVGAGRDGEGYDELSAAACDADGDRGTTPEGGGLSTPVIAAELFDMLHDPALSPAYNADRPLGGLRMVLVFGLKDEVDWPSDIEPDTILETKSGEMLGQPAEFIRPHVHQCIEDSNFDLVLGHVFVTSGEIALTWELTRSIEENGQPTTFSGAAAHLGVDEFIVTRVNLDAAAAAEGKATSGSRTVNVRPSWLDAPVRGEGGKVTGRVLVRPQFQFVDNELTGVQPGDLIEYEVRAVGERDADWHQPGKQPELTKARILIRYEPVEPLEPLGQATAVHLPLTRGGLVDIGVMLPKELFDSNTGNLPPTLELDVRGRRVPAPGIGSYGVTDLIEASTETQSGLAGRPAGGLGIDDIRFVASAEHQSVPWAETRSLDVSASAWSVVEAEGSGIKDDGVVLMRTTIEESILLGGLQADGGLGLELFIGLQDTSRATARRSPLSRCRHAVAPLRDKLWALTDVPKPEDGKSTTASEVLSSFFRQGNTARALEPRPIAPYEPIWLDQDQVTAEAIYPPARAQNSQIRDPNGNEPNNAQAAVTSPPWLRVTWEHLAWSAPQQLRKDWGPVIGYRVWVIDRLDPAYTNQTALKLASEVNVFPEPFYRAFPQSVHARGAVGADESVRADWQLHRDETGLDLTDAASPSVLLLSVDDDVVAPEGPEIGEFTGLSEGHRHRLLEDPADQSGFLITSVTAEHRHRWSPANVGRTEPGGTHAHPVTEPRESATTRRVHDHRHVLEASETSLVNDHRHAWSVGSASTNPAPDHTHPPGVATDSNFVGAGFAVIDTPLGPARLNALLTTFALEVGAALPGVFAERGKLIDPSELSFEWRAADPLLERGSELVADKPLAERITGLLESFGDDVDPYAWRRLESLGLSAEVVFRLGDESQVPAEMLVRAAERVWESEIPQLQPLKHVRLLSYLGDDARTPLDVVRLIVANVFSDPAKHPNDGTWPWERLGHPLGLLLKGRAVGADADTVLAAEPLRFADLIPAGGDATRQEPDETLLDALTQFYLRTHRALRRLASTPDNGRRICRLVRRALVDEALASVDVPIVDGTVRVDLPVGDLLGHEYRIVVEAVRRREYVFVEREVFSDPRQESGYKTYPTPTAPIAANAETRAWVDRTKPLAPHEVVATPLEGAVQALSFVHPAAFAALASAVNAARGQYSGTESFWEQRIAEEDIIQAVFATWETSGIVWADYAEWAGAVRNVIVNAEHASLDPAEIRSGDDGEPHPLEPVDGTELGLYGIDAHIMPDAPPDYEYRFVVHSTAGRIHSPWKASAYVRPAFTPIRRASINAPDRRGRLSPGVSPAAVATIIPGDGETRHLRLEVPVAMPSDHMTPLAKASWMAAEAPLTGAANAPFGLTPDLRAEYQLYLVTNYEEYANGTVGPVVVPIVKIHPVLANRALRVDEVHFFGAEVVLPGVRLVASPGTLPPNGSSSQVPGEADEQLGQVYPLLPRQGSEKTADGHNLVLGIDVDLSDPRCASFARVVQSRAAGEVLEQFLFVDLAREGMRSIMEPRDDEQAKGEDMPL